MKTRVSRHLDVLALRRLVADGRVIIVPSAIDGGRGVLASTLVPAGEKSWVAEDRSGLLGFVHVRPRRYVLGWELVHAQVRNDREACQVMAVLVQEVLQYLQGRGIPRLFARTTEGSIGNGVLVGCGFTHLLSESVFVRAPQPVEPPLETASGCATGCLRTRGRFDSWRTVRLPFW